MEFESNYERYLPLIEFVYNNNYHSSIQMTTYEVLYERRCRFFVRWFEVGEANLLGLNLSHNANEKVKIIREKLMIAQSRQKSYVNQRR